VRGPAISVNGKTPRGEGEDSRRRKCKTKCGGRKWAGGLIQVTIQTESVFLRRGEKKTVMGKASTTTKYKFSELGPLVSGKEKATFWAASKEGESLSGVVVQAARDWRGGIAEKFSLRRNYV